MARSPSTALRHVAHFISHVLIVSGLLLLSDAGLTLAWQEPVSGVQASRQQNKLEKALADPPERVRRKQPLPGDAIGKIELPAIGRKYFIVEGTDTESLRKGPGHYPDTPLPGDRGTVAIAGHRTTFGAPFRKINQLSRGDHISVSMPYGRFVYRVEQTQIVPPTALWVKKRVKQDQLILSACHPLYSAAQRIVVFARQVERKPADVKAG